MPRILAACIRTMVEHDFVKRRTDLAIRSTALSASSLRQYRTARAHASTKLECARLTPRPEGACQIRARLRSRCRRSRGSRASRVAAARRRATLSMESLRHVSPFSAPHHRAFGAWCGSRRFPLPWDTRSRLRLWRVRSCGPASRSIPTRSASALAWPHAVSRADAAVFSRHRRASHDQPIPEWRATQKKQQTPMLLKLRYINQKPPRSQAAELALTLSAIWLQAPLRRHFPKMPINGRQR